MIRRLLVANRREIALRIDRACRDLGVDAGVTYATADADSLPVKLADYAVCIDPAPARKSYLDQVAVITEALRRCRRAFRDFVLQGVATTIPFHRAVFDHPDFVSGDISTGFVDAYLIDRGKTAGHSESHAPADERNECQRAAR